VAPVDKWGRGSFKEDTLEWVDESVLIK